MTGTSGKLSARQEMFVEQYALSGNAAEAARLAGYSAKTAKIRACRLTKDNRIATEIAKRHHAYQQELQITKEEVVSGILDAIGIAREQQNPAVMISGLTQIARICGFFEPDTRRLELLGDSERLKAKFAAMSDDELLALIGQPWFPVSDDAVTVENIVTSRTSSLQR